MSTPRDYAAAVKTSSSTWWITGGEAPGPETDFGMSSTETYTLNSGITPDIVLPIERERHTLIRIDETRYFLSGGKLILENLKVLEINGLSFKVMAGKITDN